MNRLGQLIFCFLILFTTAAMAGEYTIGVLAKRGAEGFYERWLMHAAYLEKATGDTFIVKPLRFVEIEPAVAAGDIDFLLTNSSMYVSMKVKYNARAIATMVNNTEHGIKISQFGGVIFTSNASTGINTLADVKGKTFIAVKKASLGGYQMALKEFKDHDIALPEVVANLEFANTHDKVVQEVLSRPGVIGTIRTNILESMVLLGTINMQDIKILNQKKTGNFPYILSTALYPEWPMVALAKTDKRIAQKVANTLKQIRSNDLAAEMAGIAGWRATLDYSKLEIMLRTIGILAPVQLNTDIPAVDS
ncbi:phosphate/phosphite/phosphonate ABC transporter substrate-binding protein [Candidatus Venteria ishoeyi]|uniref:Tetrathionate sensor histidine kinase TtrS n=1 Tax=Candidatus Venteria ishoeyi TaxID=1899563 RepID=A0A1H6F732_9GAMM|nr:phosphate/phosphite/phosphonate ABC transporter substrate-binding protein [Candidatus Venteria ishoeyi]MDM8547967.1 phosphate/phosphite/phosphonate ABC transporter substrate-binding protein [Candidatus Venteria ishoeyi]SEH05119.1 Tetrathionate sensor histidine kinase TtrS [Candidatus Venteria ishoeyi]